MFDPVSGQEYHSATLRHVNAGKTHLSLLNPQGGTHSRIAEELYKRAIAHDPNIAHLTQELSQHQEALAQHTEFRPRFFDEGSWIRDDRNTIDRIKRNIKDGYEPMPDLTSKDTKFEDMTAGLELKIEEIHRNLDKELVDFETHFFAQPGEGAQFKKYSEQAFYGKFDEFLRAHLPKAPDAPAGAAAAGKIEQEAASFFSKLTKTRGRKWALAAGLTTAAAAGVGGWVVHVKNKEAEELDNTPLPPPR